MKINETNKPKEYPGAPDNFGRTLEAPVYTNLSALTKKLPSATILTQHAQNCRTTEQHQSTGGV